MPSEFQREVAARASEIDRRAAEYVRQGYKPWEAMRRATDDVDGARGRKARPTRPTYLPEFGPSRD